MGCASEVQKALLPLPGVVEVKTDPVTKTAVVTVDASQFNSKSALKSLAAAQFENSTIIQ